MPTPLLRRRMEPMARVDTAWLRMEKPTNLMMITGVLMFDDVLDVDRFKRLVADRFLAFRRFRQKAVDTAAGAYWETDPDFDLDWHVRLTALPGQAGQRELERLVSQLASTPLDHSKPLWQFHVVENYRGGSALISRIHHCYADGIALVQVLLSLCDAKPTAEKTAELAKTWLKDDRGSVLDRLLQPTRDGFARAMESGQKMLERGVALLADREQVATIVQEGGAIARELAQALLLPDDPPTIFKGPLGVTKRCAWADPLDLEEVKTVGRVLGCTVNDVLMAAVSGALRSYMIDVGAELEGGGIRATVPVNLRPLEHAKKLGNHFGLVFLDLPVGEANPLRRLELVAANMREIKKSRQAVMTFGVLAALGMGPHALQRVALDLFSHKASAVATNVPGPQMPLYLAGSRIADQMFWVPQSGTIGMGISILSYDGEVHFGLMVDAKLVPDPGAVIRRFKPEFEKLLLITMMEDWDAEITPADAAATFARFVASADAAAHDTDAATRRRTSKATRAVRSSRATPGKPAAPSPRATASKPSTRKRPAATKPPRERAVATTSSASRATRARGARRSAAAPAGTTSSEGEPAPRSFASEVRRFRAGPR